MRIFICEFITGGGMQGADLPWTLVQEGDLMLNALLSDLLNAGYNDLFCTRDIRLQKFHPEIETVRADKNIWQIWKNCMNECDAVWIIAPETAGVLFDLTCMAGQSGCLLLGCAPAAVELATSKKRTLEFLTKNRISCVPVIEDFANMSDQSSGWVIKPDDGVGADSCYLFTSQYSLQQYISQLNLENFVIQEYIQGIPASISMVCHGAQTIVLGCNQQLFEFNNGKGRLSGIIVNGLHEYADQFTNIAEQVGASINGLSGYIGIDLIITDQGPLVLEINPRLTTAYAGLRQSLDRNPAELIIPAIQNGQFPPRIPEYKYRPVTINL